MGSLGSRCEADTIVPVYYEEIKKIEREKNGVYVRFHSHLHYNCDVALNAESRETLFSPTPIPHPFLNTWLTQVSFAIVISHFL